MKQQALFTSKSNQPAAESSASLNQVDHRCLLLMLQSVEGIRHNKFKISDALENCADLLAGKPAPKDKQFNLFVHQVGRTIKPALLKIGRSFRVDVVRDASMFQGFIDDVLTCMGEFKDIKCKS